MRVSIQRHSHTTVQYDARIKKPLMSTPVYASENEHTVQKKQRWGPAHREANDDRVPEGFRKPNSRFVRA